MTRALFSGPFYILIWFEKEDNMSELKDSLLISIDILSSEDKALLIVGKKKPNKPIEIINAFEGEDAIRLYRKLITKKKVGGLI